MGDGADAERGWRTEPGARLRVTPFSSAIDAAPTTSQYQYKYTMKWRGACEGAPTTLPSNPPAAPDGTAGVFHLEEDTDATLAAGVLDSSPPSMFLLCEPLWPKCAPVGPGSGGGDWGDSVLSSCRLGP